MPLDTEVNKLLDSTMVLNGWNLEWLWIPHRISKLGVGIENISVTNNSVSGLLQPNMLGGSHGRKIKYDYSLYYSPIKTETTRFFHGRSPTIDLIDGKGSGSVKLDAKLCGVNGLNKHQYAIILRGFNFNTLAPYENYGFTTKGLGAWILPGVIENGKLKFDFQMRLFAQSPKQNRFIEFCTDLLDNARLRKNENFKNNVCGKNVRDPRLVNPGYMSQGFVDYTIVAAPNGHVTNWPDGKKRPSSLYKLKNLKMPNKFQKVTPIIGTNKIVYPNAFVGINGFYYEVNRDIDKRQYGIYLQKAHFCNKDFDYNPLSGIMEFNTKAFLMNDPTRFTRQRTLTNVRASFALVQTHDDHSELKEESYSGRTKSDVNKGSETSFDF